MNAFWKDIRVNLQLSQSRLKLLIGINIIVFLSINIPATFEALFLRSSHIADLSASYLQMPAYLPQLLHRFWTPLTYMFMHAGVMHILFNMLWLYWLGQIFEEYLGNKRIVLLYIIGGLSGGAFFLIGYNLIPLFAGSGLQGVSILGASASVMAIIIATATLLPDYEIFLMFLGPVKLKWLALFYVVIDLLGTAGPNAGGELAHLGGGLAGFIFIKQLQKGNDWSRPVNRIFSPRAKIKVIAGGVTRGNTTAPKAPRQDEIDIILDKISENGYESLSKIEKETLFRASKHES